MSKLTKTALLALSVTALTAELSANAYTIEELQDAREGEEAGQNRVTAVAAYSEAIDAQVSTEPEPAPEGLKVAKGKSLCTSAGIKSEGDEVTAAMVHGGAEKLAALKAKGLVM